MSSTPLQTANSAEHPVKADTPHRGIVFLGCVVLALFVAAIVFNRAIGAKTIQDKTQAQKTVTTTKSLISDTELTGVLSVGAVLIIIGLLWSRITVIKVLGAEVDLSSNEQKKAMTRIKKHVEKENVDPAKAAWIATDAYRLLLREKRQTVGQQEIPRLELGDDRIGAVVDQAISSAG